MKSCPWITLILCACMIPVHYSFDDRTFRCRNGKYIPNNWFCDGGDDCGDRSDENHPRCYRSLCGSRKFRCDNTCKNATVHCNTIPDCADGADELDCGDEINVSDCKWQNEKYLCDDNLRCIDFNNTCDGAYCHCFDCSDEKADCLNDEEMEEYTKKVPHLICFRTPLGPHCCSEFDSICHECSENQCEQKCIQFRREQRCLCDENYIGVTGTNNSKCVSNESKNNLLLYSTDNELGMLNLHTNKSHVIKDKIEVTSLAGAFGHVYFATYNNRSSKGSILKILNGSDTIQEIITINSKISSLAIDWITNNTYYSTNTSTIDVCSENGDFCKQLKSCNAHSVGLAPRFGLLFWVETNPNETSSTQRIMKSEMDGSNEKSLTTYEKTSWPIRITVDELTERIYFWTRLTDLSYISFDEKRKKIVVFDHLPAVFATFEKHVYFASHETNTIHAGYINSKLFSATILMTRPNATLVTHLYAYNPKLQRTKITNPCAKSCPNGLCLLRPTSSRKTLNYTCVNDNLIRRHEHSTEPEQNPSAETTHSKGNPSQNPVTAGTVPIAITRPKGNTNRKHLEAEENAPIEITRSKDDTEQNSGNEAGSIVAVILINAFVTLSVVLCVAAIILFYFRKRFSFQNDCRMERNIPLQPRVNNELLTNIAECAEFNKPEYKKSNLNKLDCSTSAYKDVNYVG